MKINEGALDRTIRLVVGIIALYLSFTRSFWWLVLAIPAIITSLTGFCKLYELLGITTAKKSIKKKN
jgi:hypothetical protein